MNVILISSATPDASCGCCGASATTHVAFSGPGSDRKASLDLCGGCRRLLGNMLADDSEQSDQASEVLKTLAS